MDSTPAPPPLSPLPAGAHAAAAAPARAPLLAGLSYLLPTGVKPCNYTHEPPPGVPWESGAYVTRQMPLHDGRCAPQPPALDREGFELRHAPSRVRDFRDVLEVMTTGYDEAGELALAATGGTHAFVFDHVLRLEHDSLAPPTFSRAGPGGRPAANSRVHNDYTEASGARRLGLALGDPTALARVARFCIVNLWRPIHRPVQQSPLALCDARTVRPWDLVTGEVRYPTRSGEIHLVAHASCHRWSYFPDMQPEEVLVFKQFDSQCSGTSRFTPHAAFRLPGASADAPARESVEMRCLVVF